MFSVILLVYAFIRLVDPAESNLVAHLGWQKGFETSPLGRKALCCSRSHCVAHLLERLDQASSVSSSLLPHLFRVNLRLFLHDVRFGARRLYQQSVPRCR